MLIVSLLGTSANQLILKNLLGIITMIAFVSIGVETKRHIVLSLQSDKSPVQLYKIQ